MSNLQTYDQWLDEAGQDAFESQVEGVVQELYFDEGCVHGAEKDECRICKGETEMPAVQPNYENAELKQQQVEAWNREHPVGSKVLVTRDNGETLETTVKREAELLGGHSPVAWVDGISGCYAISRITAVPTPLCPIHKQIDERGTLEMEIGGLGCLACTLQERVELLALLAPFADGSTDSVTTLRKVVDFCGTAVNLQRELAFYFGAYHATLDHRLDAAACMENECVRVRGLLK